MVLAGVELGDVTVVTGEDCKERAQHRSTEVHRNPTGQWGLARKPTPFQSIITMGQIHLELEQLQVTIQNFDKTVGLTSSCVFKMKINVFTEHKLIRELAVKDGQW